MNITRTASQLATFDANATSTPHRVVKSVCVSFAIALLLAAAAQVRYPVPGSPVPATLQTLVVLCAGTLVGTRIGIAGAALYLLFGLAGFAVFASGPADWRALPGPTAGYLAGFLLAQPILGQFTARRQRNGFQIATAIILAQTLIFALGLSWLKFWSQAGWDQVLAMGLWPFVPVDVSLKMVAAFGVAWVGGRHARNWIERA